MTEPLPDIRVGDIMVLNYGSEVVVDRHLRGDLWVVREYPSGSVYVHAKSDELSNPDFRVGDKVRLRGGGLPHLRWDATVAPHRWALVERAPVAEKKPRIMHPWVSAGAGVVWLRRHTADGKFHTLARVEKAVHPDGTWIVRFDGEQLQIGTLQKAKDYADKWLAREGWVERALVSDTVKQERKAGFIIEAWKQWPEHKDDGSCTAEGCGVCAIDKAEDTVPDNKPFVKHDAAKPRMDLLPPLALQAMARTMGYGITKGYGEANWRSVPREDRKRFVAAALRHITAVMAGEDLDPESGESHWAHVMFNAAVLCELAEIDRIASDEFRK